MNRTRREHSSEKSSLLNHPINKNDGIGIEDNGF